jgi:hypothetical protein
MDERAAEEFWRAAGAEMMGNRDGREEGWQKWRGERSGEKSLKKDRRLSRAIEERLWVLLTGYPKPRDVAMATVKG